jgi:hypothetical protein
MHNQLPAQVQRMSDKSDALIKEINEAGKSEEEKAGKETIGKIEAEPTVKEPENQKPPVKTDTEETWEQRYRALQGKYNKEIKEPRDALKMQVRNLTLRINEGDSELRRLQDELAQKENVPVQEKVKIPDSIMSLLSEEERSHMNEEGFDNKSMEIFGSLMSKVSSMNTPTTQTQSVDLEELKQEVAINKHNREATFWKELNNKKTGVPDWEAINESVDFNDWLDEVIPYTKTTKRAALKIAERDLDYEEVIRMFNDFKGTQHPKEEPKKLHINPEEHIEPSSTVGHVEPTEDKPKGKIYTLTEVKKFYSDYTRGKYTAEQYAQISADIDKANQEGRITN